MDHPDNGMPPIAAINHVSITVTDIARSLSWYRDILGLANLLEEKHADGSGQYVVLGKPDWSMCIGLHTHSTNERERFSEARTGLDHVSFFVPARADLDAWEARLTEYDVEHSPVNDQPHYSVLVFRDPDNVQLEFISMG